MPAEPTKAKLKRRTSRKDLDEYRYENSHTRELELKRNRGEVSCAECRRLKIKCDKQIPCQSCQRRGCAALCPNGSLATGQGTRFVLAATEHLHRRIAKLSGRIRLLEDALSTLHAKHSSEPHPLLHEDLIHVEEREGEMEGGVGEKEDGAGTTQPGDALEAFGTLSISEHGISRFFGPTGGSESLLLANLDASHASPEGMGTPDSMSGSKSPSSIGDLALFSQAFPFTPMGQPADVQELIESHLPPLARTLALCETYFAQVSWIFRGVTRVQLIDDMLPVIYRRAPAPPGEDYSGPHDLALLFVVLAVGALVGETPSNALGEHYHQISRAAISLQPVLEKPSIVTIQTLHLMSIYNAMSGSDLKSETSMEMTWSLITLAAHLSQTIGLHRDSARWGLSAKMVQRRRILFWDLFVADVWQSLNTGRPPSFSIAYIDCSYPQYSTADLKSEGGFGSSFEVWQCRFAAECVADVTARTLTAEAPSYATIMELDRKVREFPLPEDISSSPDDLAASFQRCVLDHIRETVLMYIHRSFFAQAIIEHPVNPLKSAYAPSFLAAYRASSTILKSIRDQFNVFPNTSSRFWTMWTFAFSAAVVFGTVVTRGPRSPLAQSAMAELDQAVVLFSKAAMHSIRATKALPILTKLSEKARHALAAAQNDMSPMTGDKGGLLWNIKQEEENDDELSIFAGHTRFVSAKRGPDSGPSSSTNSIRFEPSPPHFPMVPSQGQPQMGSDMQAIPIDLRQPQQQQQHHQISRQHSNVSLSGYQPPGSIALSESTSSNSSMGGVGVGVGSWGAQVDMGARDAYMAAPLEQPLHYQYAASERTHMQQQQPSAPQREVPSTAPAASGSYGWSGGDMRPPHQQPVASSSTRSIQQTPYQTHQQPVSQHAQRQQRPPPSSIPQSHQQQQQHQYSLHSAHVNAVEYQPPAHSQVHYAAQYPAEQRQIPRHMSSQEQLHEQRHPQAQAAQYPSMYGSGGAGAYTSQTGAPPNMDLADLGLAARDSRLDERWGSFMADSGLLEDFRGR